MLDFLNVGFVESLESDSILWPVENYLFKYNLATLGRGAKNIKVTCRSLLLIRGSDFNYEICPFLGPFVSIKKLSSFKNSSFFLEVKNTNANISPAGVSCWWIKWEN